MTIYKLIVDNIPPERRILWDSKKLGGRPNTMALLEEVYVKWNAEGAYRCYCFLGYGFE
jgi:hypothetical protein